MMMKTIKSQTQIKIENDKKIFPKKAIILLLLTVMMIIIRSHQ